MYERQVIFIPSFSHLDSKICCILFPDPGCLFNAQPICCNLHQSWYLIRDYTSPLHFSSNVQYLTPIHSLICYCIENSTVMSVILKDHERTHPYTNTHGRKIHSYLRLVIDNIYMFQTFKVFILKFQLLF